MIANDDLGVGLGRVESDAMRFSDQAVNIAGSGNFHGAFLSIKLARNAIEHYREIVEQEGPIASAVRNTLRGLDKYVQIRNCRVDKIVRRAGL